MNNISTYDVIVLGFLAFIGLIIVLIEGFQEAGRHRRYMQVW